MPKEISIPFFVSNRRVLLAQVSTRLVLGEQIKASRISYEVNHVEANPVSVFFVGRNQTGQHEEKYRNKTSIVLAVLREESAQCTGFRTR